MSEKSMSSKTITTMLGRNFESCVFVSLGSAAEKELKVTQQELNSPQSLSAVWA
jgi:hypothetical protein